jgi:hypothetical protein
VGARGARFNHEAGGLTASRDDEMRAYDKRRQERQRGGAVPRIEVAVTEVGEKAEEPGRAADGERPPGPALTVTQRKGREPQIEHGHRDQRPAECDAVVEHERDDPAVGVLAELLGADSQEGDVVRQELAPRRQEDREQARDEERDARQRQERAAVTHQGRQEPAIRGRAVLVHCWAAPTIIFLMSSQGLPCEG